MAEETGVKDAPPASTADNNQDESLKKTATESDNSEGDESIKAVPYPRFKEVIDARDQQQQIANWYRENIGDPNDVVEFRKWKAEQVKKAESAEAEGDISPAKLAEIKKLMRKADPEYAEFLERQKMDEQTRIEAQFDQAEEDVRDLCAEELGLKKKEDEPRISRIGQYVMLEIKNDPKLLRMWQAGNTTAVIKKAFKVVKDEHEGLTKNITRMRQEAEQKRKVSKLPTLPSASGSLTQGSGPNGSDKREKGITKQAHEDAWAILQQSMQD